MAIPKVVSGTFELPSGKVIEVGSKAWFDWLDLSETRSFRFNDGVAGFTARKEKVKGQDGYWYAYVSTLGKTRKKYLGKADSLTQEKMTEVERQLHNSENITQTQTALPKEVLGKAANKSASAESFDIERLKAEILAELRAELHRELGKIVGTTAELTGESPQIGQSEASVNFGQMKKELDEARSQLADRQREIEDLELELENARAGEQMFRDEIAELRAEVEELTVEIPQPWQCWAVNRQTGEERLVASGATEKEVKRQAIKIFASSEDAAFPAEEWEIVYRQQPASFYGEKMVPDYDALAAAALASLKLGKQAPGYKAAAKAIAKFRELLQ